MTSREDYSHASRYRDLFFHSHLFLKGTLCCVIRRHFTGVEGALRGILKVKVCMVSAVVCV